MAPGKWHWVGGFATWIGFDAFYVTAIGNSGTSPIDPNVIWGVTSLLLCLTGALFPDWDQLAKWLHHRDILTHSALVPLLITLPFLVVELTGQETSLIFALGLGPFMWGIASHLLIDLFPSFDVDKLLREEGPAETISTLMLGFVEGMTGEELVKHLRGTYLIHLPWKAKVLDEDKVGKWEERKTLPKHQTRIFLTVNGLISIYLGLIILNQYLEFSSFSLLFPR